MTPTEQKEFLEVTKAFVDRCKELPEGMYKEVKEKMLQMCEQRDGAYSYALEVFKLIESKRLNTSQSEGL